MNRTECTRVIELCARIVIINEMITRHVGQTSHLPSTHALLHRPNIAHVLRKYDNMINRIENMQRMCRPEGLNISLAPCDFMDKK